MLNDPLRPPNPSARLAGVIFIILGSLALLARLSFLAYGAAVPTLQNDAAIKQQLDDLRRQTAVDLKPSDLQIIAYVAGSVFAAYGLTAIVAGLFIRALNRVASIVGICLAGGVVLLLGLCSLSLLLQGGAIPQFIVITGLIAVHVWLIKLQIDALRNAPTAASPAFNVPSPYQPMQAYYLAPTRPGA